MLTGTYCSWHEHLAFGGFDDVTGWDCDGNEIDDLGNFTVLDYDENDKPCEFLPADSQMRDTYRKAAGLE